VPFLRYVKYRNCGLRSFILKRNNKGNSDTQGHCCEPTVTSFHIVTLCPTVTSVPIVATVYSNSDISFRCATVCFNNDPGSCGLPSSLEKCDRQTDIDGPIRCFSSPLEHEEHLKRIQLCHHLCKLKIHFYTLYNRYINITESACQLHVSAINGHPQVLWNMNLKNNC
jgi:hypothetical protein